MSSSTPIPSRVSLSLTDSILVNLLDSEVNAIAGATAGVISALAVCPLDVAKTKLQAQGGFVSLQEQYKKLGSKSGLKAPLHRPSFVEKAPTSNVANVSRITNATISSTTSGGNVTSSLSMPLSVSSSKLVNTPSSASLNAAPKYKGVIGTLSTIVKEEGIPGLYRGVIPITVGYLPTWAIYFVVYEDCKKYTSKHFAQYPFVSNMISALTAGASSTLVTNPIWVVKTRLMAQPAGNLHYSGTIDAFSKMFREEGIISFYAGLGPALLGLLHVAVQFPLYEKCKKVFHVDDENPKLHQIPQILASSVISKICASTITYPHEVIRTRIQVQPNIRYSSTAESNSASAGAAVGKTSSPKSSSHSSSRGSYSSFNKRNTSVMKYHGIIQTTKTIFLEEGWRAFYSGLATNMVRTVPASALTLLSYEVIASTIRNRQKLIREFLGEVVATGDSGIDIGATINGLESNAEITGTGGQDIGFGA